MDLGTHKSVDAEIWSGDTFWDDMKSYRGDFWNFDFSRFSGDQSPKFSEDGNRLWGKTLPHLPFLSVKICIYTFLKIIQK